MSKPENPLAFPLVDGPTVEPGMLLRDWFAGQVLSSAAALPSGTADCQHRAKVAYEQADAMLAERDKEIGS